MHRSAVSRRRFLSLSGLAAAGGLLARNPLARACPIHEDIGPAVAVAGGINAFAADLHARLSRDEKNTLFFSPFSISTALAMTSAGARGETLAEMEKTLHLPKEPHAAFGDLLARVKGSGKYATRMPRKYELSVANNIWAHAGFPWNKEFAELVSTRYWSEVVETDFTESEKARKKINDWVADATRDRIKELIPAGVITALTRMVLANAIYFKGDWQVKFDKKDTKVAPFLGDDGTTADVPLMNLTSEFNYGEFTIPISRRPDRVQVLEMPYAGKELSMLVYLPDGPLGVNRLARSLTADQLGKPQLKSRKVQVSLPRFKAESALSLKPVLMDMGMKKAFGGADFTGMSPEGKRLHISHVLHKAVVDVNEEGSEAAAATAVIIKERVSAHPDLPVEFRADRPFVFTIRENTTGAILFLGRYSGPKA